MKIILITGGRRAGKSHILLYTAKVLANAGFKVLAVDATRDGDILSFFNIKHYLEDRFNLDGSSVINREGFDIMALGMQFDANLLEPHVSEKDFILIETDRVLSIPPYVPVQTILVQDMDKENLYSLKAITHQNLKNYPEMPARILINNYIRCKLSLKYICHTLGTSPAVALEPNTVITESMLYSIFQELKETNRLRDYELTGGLVGELVSEGSYIDIEFVNTKGETYVVLSKKLVKKKLANDRIILLLTFEERQADKLCTDRAEGPWRQA